MTGLGERVGNVLRNELPGEFTPYESIPGLIRSVADKSEGRLRAVSIGKSEEGRELVGVDAGAGAFTISLVAGAHADEPVGCETLLHLIRRLSSEEGSLLHRHFRFLIVPHVNPDGAARNRPWIDEWPDPYAYVSKAIRELPGKDIEFGYPSMRPENEAVAGFIAGDGPVDLHMSLHGMGFAEGVLLLINREWKDRTDGLRATYRSDVAAAGLPLHDHDRKGEKGFEYLGPGFTTTPRGAAMRAYFESLGDEATAKLFHDSSMEMMTGLGGDPLCLVTEVPLFVVRGDQPSPPGYPAAYLQFKNELAAIREKIKSGAKFDALLKRFQIEPVQLEIAISLQLKALIAGICAKSAGSGSV